VDAISLNYYARVRKSSFICGAVALVASLPVQAWDDVGHEVTALIAYRHLTLPARRALDALLAADTDTLTAPDFASRATWADKYRNLHRETSAWHYINIEIDQPDIGSACFGFPALGGAQLASDGPAQDCIVNKIDEFSLELRSLATPPGEKLLALKFLIHFIGDLHQPLHVGEHEDRGGNCIGLSPALGRQSNLHAYWDAGVIGASGETAQHIADRLDKDITAEQMKEWGAGNSHAWAMESFELARHDAYALPSLPTCQSPGTVALSPIYQAQAQKDAAVQLRKAAIRMAGLLNWALGS
jgi:hypothetical protein